MDTQGTHLYTLWQKRRKLRLRLFLVVVLFVCTFSWLRPHIFQPNPQKSSETALGTSNQPTNRVTQESPNFAAITPSSKSVEWSKLSPPGSDSFYVFTDSISGVPIRVSEQKVPESLSEGSALADLAKSYNANRTIVSDGITVYIGASVKEQQSVIFVKRSLLILITSNDILNDHQWSEYISSLQ